GEDLRDVALRRLAQAEKLDVVAHGGHAKYRARWQATDSAQKPCRRRFRHAPRYGSFVRMHASTPIRDVAYARFRPGCCHPQVRRPQARDHVGRHRRARAATVESTLVNAIAYAHRWERMPETRECGSISQLAAAGSIERASLCRVRCSKRRRRSSSTSHFYTFVKT
ncbi:MAG TPA: hypothetical protein VFJ18_03970, partial [Pararhizobium sp.]|nr:hypothetical protein [Pararhizobium sp.]